MCKSFFEKYSLGGKIFFEVFLINIELYPICSKLLQIQTAKILKYTIKWLP